MSIYGGDADHDCDAIRDLGPAPTWKEVVAMRRELDAAVAYHADYRDAIDKLLGQPRDHGSMLDNHKHAIERLREENAKLTGDRYVAAQRLNEWDELVDIARRVEPVRPEPNVAKDCVAVFGRLAEECERLREIVRRLEWYAGEDIDPSEPPTPAEVAEFEAQEREKAKPKPAEPEISTGTHPSMDKLRVERSRTVVDVSPGMEVRDDRRRV